MTFKQWLKQQELYPVYDCEHVHGLMKKAWQAATERAAEIVEEADWQPIALLGKNGLNNLSKAIRQQDSTEVWTQEEIDKAKAEAQNASWWWQESADVP